MWPPERATMSLSDKPIREKRVLRCEAPAIIQKEGLFSLWNRFCCRSYKLREEPWFASGSSPSSGESASCNHFPSDYGNSLSDYDFNADPLVISVCTLRPGVNWIVGPPVTSTATTPASWNENKESVKAHNQGGWKFYGSLAYRDDIYLIKVCVRDLRMLGLYFLWNQKPKFRQRQRKTATKDCQVLKSRGNNRLKCVINSPQKATAFSKPLLCERFSSSLNLIDPLGPPVFFLASYVPASCHLYAHTHHQTRICIWKLQHKNEEWIMNFWERRSYARRSIMGAQFLEEMRARRSLRVFSISLRYSASTFTIIVRLSKSKQNNSDRWIGLKNDSKWWIWLSNVIYIYKIEEESKVCFVIWKKQSIFFSFLGEPFC